MGYFLKNSSGKSVLFIEMTKNNQNAWFKGHGHPQARYPCLLEVDA